MNEEQASRLSAELLEAGGEADRSKVLIRWLPELVRCQIKTAGRAKRLVEDMVRLEAKVDRLHSAPSFKSDKLGWLRANWQWLVLFLLLLKQNGLDDLLERVFALGGGL